MLSPEDNALLLGAGNVFLQDINALITISVLYGAYDTLPLVP